MQSLLDTLLLFSVTVCTLAVSMIVGCGGAKKPKVMTDMPTTGEGSKMGGAGSNSGAPPPAPPPTAVSQDGNNKTPSAKDKKDGGAAPKSLKPATPATNPVDQSDKRASQAKKVPEGAVEDDGGYENCKDMSPAELAKAL